MLRFLIIVLIFVVLGPPIGGFALVLAKTPHLLLQGGFPAAAGVAVWSYYFGALPALAAGIMVGARQAYRRSVSALILLLVGLVAGVGFVLVWSGVRLADWMDPRVGALIVTCIFATFVCWAIARACLRRLPSSTRAVS